MRKCDNCIYSEPYGEHDEHKCHHPKNTGHLDAYPAVCATCKEYKTAKQLLEPCPFCGLRPILRNYKSRFHVICEHCDFEFSAPTSSSLDKLIERWNSRRA